MPFAFLFQLSSALPSLTHRSTGTNCDALTSCTSCVPYSACGWCASSSTCLNADPFSPKRRAANTRCFAPAWMHGVDVASECPTSRCHANSHAEPCRLDEACGWCTGSDSCHMDREFSCGNDAKEHVGMAGTTGNIMCPAA